MNPIQEMAERATRRQLLIFFLSAGIMGAIAMVSPYLAPRTPLAVVLAAAFVISLVAFVSVSYPLFFKSIPDARVGSDERTDIGPCAKCGGARAPATASHLREKGEEIVVFLNVPVERCENCGELWFSDEILDEIDRRAEYPADLPKRNIPIWHFRGNEPSSR